MGGLKQLEEILQHCPAVGWGVEIFDVAQDVPLFSWRADRVLKTASLAKVFLLLEVAARIEDGRLAAQDLLRCYEAGGVDGDSVAGSGLLQFMQVGALPVADLALLVAAISDNRATNILLHHVGLPAVQRRSVDLGYPDTQMHDFVRSRRGADDAPTFSSGRAKDWTEIFARLYRGELVSPAVDRRVLHWLGAGVDHSMILSACGCDPLSHGSTGAPLSVINKTGRDDGICADAGLILGARVLSYSVIANGPVGYDGMRSTIAAMKELGEYIFQVAAHCEPGLSKEPG